MKYNNIHGLRAKIRVFESLKDETPPVFSILGMGSMGKRPRCNRRWKKPSAPSPSSVSAAVVHMTPGLHQHQH